MAIANHRTLPDAMVSIALCRVNKSLLTLAVQLQAYGKLYCVIIFNSLEDHCELEIATASKCAIRRSLFELGNAPFWDAKVS